MSTATFELKPWAFVVYSLVFGIAGLAAVGYVDPEMRLTGFDGSSDIWWGVRRAG